MKTLAVPGDLEEIRGRIGRLMPEDGPRWGSMDVRQMVCHVRDSFECPLGERAVRAVKGPPIPVPVYKWLALWVPRQWPQGVPTTPEMMQGVGGTPPAEFEADRATLIEKLDCFIRASGPWGAHPMFGAMTTKEWMRWGYLHTDHHLRQFGR